MIAFLNRIHARVGDLWWYSAMIFIACRSGDVINAFIGLWLVPKYVGPDELGAVLPLQQLTTFLTVPLGVIAVVFSKFVNTYATHGEYGKVKSFIHDVFIVSLILFIICTVGAYLIMPLFYERLRVGVGSLTILILLCGLVGNIGTIVGSAQQGLKRFKTMSAITLLSAPVRLLTLLVAMPIRALSGYMLGQTTPGIVTTAFSLVDIHQVLKPYVPDTSWRHDLRDIWHYLWPYAIFLVCGLFFATVSTTVYRQRLPEIESAAYYMLSRFAETAGYVGVSISTILFPLVSEAHESGKNTAKLLNNSLWGIIGSTLLIAVIFYFFGSYVFTLTTTWKRYLDYVYLLPFLTINMGLTAAIAACTSHELACRRFSMPFFITIFNLIWTIILVSFTGYEYFNGTLPPCILKFMKNCHLADLPTLTYVSLISAIIQLVIIQLYIRKHNEYTT